MTIFWDDSDEELPMLLDVIQGSIRGNEALAWSIARDTRSGAIYLTVDERVKMLHAEWRHLTDDEVDTSQDDRSIVYVSRELKQLRLPADLAFSDLKIKGTRNQDAKLPLAHYIMFDRMWPEFLKRYVKWVA